MELLILVVFPGLMAFAGAMDMFTMTIPNKISIGLLVGFLIIAPLAGLGLYDVGLHLACGFAVLMVTIGMFALNLMGGGDAKIYAAASVWFGFEYTLMFIVFSALAGGVLTVVLLLMRWVPMPDRFLRAEWFARLHNPATGVPYGIGIAAAALIVYPKMPWVLGSIA